MEHSHSGQPRVPREPLEASRAGEAPELEGYSTLEVANTDSHQEQKEVVANEDGANLPQALHPDAMPQTQYSPPGFRTYYGPQDRQDAQSPDTTNYQYSIAGSNFPPQSEAAMSEHKAAEEAPRKRQRRICGLAPTTFWILATLVVLGGIAAIVGGALGAVLSAGHRDITSPSSSDSAKNGNGSSNGSGTSSNSSEASPSPNPASTARAKLLDSSQLAAANWTDKDRNTHYAVFTQDSSSALLLSLWDSKNQTWEAVNVSSSIAGSGNAIELKPGTPLTAFSTGPPSYDFELNVGFLDAKNVITFFKTNDMAGKSWELGEFMSGPPRVADENSGLASTWHRCNTGPGCNDKMIIVYQSGSRIMALNSTDWSAPEAPDVDISPGTSLNLFMVNGGELRLYYQSSEKVMTELKWSPVEGWLFGYNPANFLAAPGNIQMAGAPYAGLNKTFVASTNTDGRLTAYIWNSRNWISNTAVTATQAPKNTNTTFRAIAQHYEHRLYGVVGDSVQEYLWDEKSPTTLVYVDDIDIEPSS